MRILYFLCFLFLNHFSLLAQQQSVENIDNLEGGGAIRFYDPTSISQKKVDLNYSDIRGTPFWNDNWKTALLVMKNGTAIKLGSVKLNLYTADVHYIDNKGIELVAETGSVERIIFYKEKDTSHVLSVFESFPDIGESAFSYYRVLNIGKVQLLELIKSLVRTAEYDPLIGKKVSSFITKSNYYISDNGNLLPLKTFGRSNILSIVHHDANTEEWLNQNSNKLKNESAVVSFLNYYNKLKK